MKTQALESMINRGYELLPRLNGPAALITRLFVGGFFMNTGWGKMHDLEQFAKNFAGWGIPYPHFNAALSAYTEFYGGLLTVVGLGTRLVAIPMIINMLVAIFSVVLRFNVSSLGDFLNADEPLYVLTYVWLIISGGGWLSLDSLLKYATSIWLPVSKDVSNPTARATLA
jgi:putative oxidoreductase